MGLEATADACVSTGYRPGRKVATVVAGILAGAECIDDLAVLRAGSTGRVLATKVMAPSTVGTWLRSLTFGHVRQLDRLSELMLSRAWAAGTGPADAAMTVDVDSTICAVHGHAKQGAAYGYTGQLGYHPLLATRADTGEVVHSRHPAPRPPRVGSAPMDDDQVVTAERGRPAQAELPPRPQEVAGGVIPCHRLPGGRTFRYFRGEVAWTGCAPLPVGDAGHPRDE